MHKTCMCVYVCWRVMIVIARWVHRCMSLALAIPLSFFCVAIAIDAARVCMHGARVCIWRVIVLLASSFHCCMSLVLAISLSFFVSLSKT